jgi:maltooligosyltrehalose trehalohydrolase
MLSSLSTRNLPVIVGPHSAPSGRCEFTVWAPFRSKIELQLIAPRKEIIPMTKSERGYWSAAIDDESEEITYRYLLDGALSRPDPASRHQPDGVHGASRISRREAFRWEDEGWKGIPLSDSSFYELHVGTFTPEGTFGAIVSRLQEIKDTGINIIELMPVAQFPGERNWGYDGVYPFAVQHSYGGPLELKKLVNACHRQGIGIALDVVYNHLGPEGNYFADFGPYVTDTYKTPWGKAINFDSAQSDEVRNYFIQNALYWLEQFHIDALRLDAVHAIYDMSAHPFLQELAEEVEKFSAVDGRTRHLIAESDLNDARVIKPRELGGFGFDAQWNDDFHHSLHALLTKENTGYYADFGEIDQLVKSVREGFVYAGQYSIFRKRRHGNSSVGRPAGQFIVFSQNHDQIGNRASGERLSMLISFEALKTAAALTVLSPYLPLLFMGEEYAERAPFLYFVHHSDERLIEAVRQGRKAEFEQFAWTSEPRDPQSPDTFSSSKLHWEQREAGEHGIVLAFYKELFRLRREVPALARSGKKNVDVFGVERTEVMILRRWFRRGEIAAVFNLGTSDVEIKNPLRRVKWEKILDSSDARWDGPGSLLPDRVFAQSSLALRNSSAAVFQTRR